MASHSKQHFVPSSYLKAWCDPTTPTNQEPYVWVFSKDGTKVRRKAPHNIFHETDLYTIQAEDRRRDLVLEHGLSELEDEFVKIRAKCLELQRVPTQRQHLYLCAFIGAMDARTLSHRDHFSAEWGKVLVMMDEMREWLKTATPEQRLGASGIGPSDPHRSFSYDEVKEMATKPLQTSLVAHISAEVPMLMKLDLAVLNAVGSSRFITSDCPCVWFDPEAYKRPPLYRAPGLAYPSTEITLPVSPRQMILLNRGGRRGYYAAPDFAVEELNRRTRFHCRENFVNFENATLPTWFDPGVEPGDSWERKHTKTD